MLFTQPNNIANICTEYIGEMKTKNGLKKLSVEEHCGENNELSILLGDVWPDNATAAMLASSVTQRSASGGIFARLFLMHVLSKFVKVCLGVAQ